MTINYPQISPRIEVYGNVVIGCAACLSKNFEFCNRLCRLPNSKFILVPHRSIALRLPSLGKGKKQDISLIIIQQQSFYQSCCQNKKEEELFC